MYITFVDIEGTDSNKNKQITITVISKKKNFQNFYKKSYSEVTTAMQPLWMQFVQMRVVPWYGWQA